MNLPTPDLKVLNDDWSDLRNFREIPEIDFQRLEAYRRNRLKMAMEQAGVSMCVLVNPISLRYAADYRNYLLFQSHIPTTYLFISPDGPEVFHNAYEPDSAGMDIRRGRPVSFFDGGDRLQHYASQLAQDICDYLMEIGSSNRKVAVEQVNPSITRSLLERDIEVVDGAPVAEGARTIKSRDEIACMRWAIAVAEHGISKMREALVPGVSELQLWALLNYTNVANNGDWHEGRMLASGPRINPWLREASGRRVESGDLVGFDTDMIGPFGYFADISRTLHCGPARPTLRQKQVYRLAAQEITHNLGLVRPGITLREIQERAFPVPEEFQKNAYPCVMHAVGMCDEYPQVKPIFRGPNPYDCAIEAGMVLCIESYMGAEGESVGVKLEQQVLVTDDGYEMLTRYPLEEDLL